jgi:hypothetical protein
MQIASNLRRLAEQRIAAGYDRGNFGVAVPFNPRSVNDVAIGLFPGWFGLLVAAGLAHTWLVAFIALAAIGASAASITLLEKTCVELPTSADALTWQFREYGRTTRCGLWSPIARCISYGLRAPVWTLGGIAAWAVYRLATQ